MMVTVLSSFPGARRLPEQRRPRGVVRVESARDRDHGSGLYPLPTGLPVSECMV